MRYLRSSLPKHSVSKTSGAAQFFLFSLFGRGSPLIRRDFDAIKKDLIRGVGIDAGAALTIAERVDAFDDSLRWFGLGSGPCLAPRSDLAAGHVFDFQFQVIPGVRLPREAFFDGAGRLDLP